MASGRTHDIVNLVVLPPVVYYFQPDDFISFTAGYLFGTFFLSPDTDLYHSKPVKRWKILKFIWYPLTKFSKHRGLSHIPVVGSLIRFGYLSLLLLLIYIGLFYALRYLDVELPFLVSLEEVNFKSLLLNIHFISFFLGLVFSEIVHIFTDIIYSSLKRMRLIR